jgi:hypothetical protein
MTDSTQPEGNSTLVDLQPQAKYLFIICVWIVALVPCKKRIFLLLLIRESTRFSINRSMNILQALRECGGYANFIKRLMQDGKIGPSVVSKHDYLRSLR